MYGFPTPCTPVYDRNHAILKTYTPACNKVILMRGCRLPGYEEQSKPMFKRNSAGHEEKLRTSLSRTRSKVFELAMCNPWEYFVTLTLSPENGNRRDLRTFKQSLSKWLNNLNYRRGCSIKYLLIPEPHADGSWHIHGLFMGIPEDMLVAFTLQDHLPHRLLKMLRNGHELYNWPGYAKKFGYVTCERIRNLDACAKYITKYITKELGEGVSRLNEKLYLCSHGLKRAEIAYRGHLVQEFVPDFCNDYVATKVFPSFDEALALFDDSEYQSFTTVSFPDMVSHYSGGNTSWNTFLPA